MKAGGIKKVYQMILKAKNLNLNVMIGCMTETSCAVSAAAQLATKANWADLDGNLLISNDPYSGIKINDGNRFI